VEKNFSPNFSRRRTNHRTKQVKIIKYG